MNAAVTPTPNRRMRPRHAPPVAVAAPALVIVVGIVLSITLPNGGPIVLGAGLAVAACVALHAQIQAALEHVRTALAPLRRVGDTVGAAFVSLALTARPLVLPLLAALTVGTFEMAWPLQMLAGAGFVLIAWLAVIHPEERSLKLMLDEAHQDFDFGTRWLRKHAVWLAVLLVLAVPAWLATRSAIAYFKAIGGLAAFLLVLALFMWIAALLLRLAGQATSYLRIALAIVLWLGLLRGAMAIGLLPGDRVFSDAVPWLPTALAWTAAGLFALDVVLGAAYAWRLRHRPGSGGRTRDVVAALVRKRWRGRSSVQISRPLQLRSPARRDAARVEPLRIVREYGLTAAVGATVVLLACAVYGLAATTHPGHSLAKPGVRAGDAAVAVPPGGDRALADAYSPVLALTADEPWSPISVDGYLQHARLNQAAAPVGALSALPSSCGRAGVTNCDRLTIDCPSGHAACAHGELGPAGRRPRSATLHMPADGAVYARVVHRDRPPADGSPNPFAGWSTSDPRLAGLATLIQYWYFYYYDDWEAPAFAGLLTQRHESDWEAVTVGLSDTRPLFVAYSEHCSGTWVRWPRAEVSTSAALPARTHPLVAVARGSQANYPEADQERSPDWTHCQGLPAGLTTLVSYASNIRDKTEYAWLWHQPERGLILVNARTSPMSFPGSWGRHDETVLDNFKANQIAVNGSGPLSPPLQELWRHPLQKIFCTYSHPAGYVPSGCPSG